MTPSLQRFPRIILQQRIFKMQGLIQLSLGANLGCKKCRNHKHPVHQQELRVAVSSKYQILTLKAENFLSRNRTSSDKLLLSHHKNAEFHLKNNCHLRIMIKVEMGPLRVIDHPEEERE